MFFLMVLLASSARAEDLPLGSPHFEAGASGTSVEVALENAVQQASAGPLLHLIRPLVMREPGVRLNLRMP